MLSTVKLHCFAYQRTNGRTDEATNAVNGKTTLFYLLANERANGRMRRTNGRTDEATNDACCCMANAATLLLPLDTHRKEANVSASDCMLNDVHPSEENVIDDSL